MRYKHKRSNVEGRVPAPSVLAVGELAVNFKDHCIYTSDGVNVFTLCSTLDRTVYSVGEYIDDYIKPIDPPIIDPPIGYKLEVNNIASWTTQGSTRVFSSQEYDYDIKQWVNKNVDVVITPTTYTSPDDVINIKNDLAIDDSWYLLRTTSPTVYFNDTKSTGSTLKSGSGYGLIAINFKLKKIHIGTFESGWNWVYTNEPTVFDFNELNIAASNLSLDVDISAITNADTYRDVPYNSTNIKALKDLI